MYNAFYGFSRKPFSISPDPDFLYSNSTYRELVAVLRYGILEQKGIICLIGEVGTGKTMVINHLTGILEKRVQLAKISFPGLGFHGILDAMTTEFGIAGGAKTISERLASLTDFLVSANDKGHIVALLVDEAQALGVKSLEFIRMLSNLETPKEKLLQVVLSGQPELKEKLNLPQLRQFKQRIALAFYLKPLSLEEIPLYIAHRIRVAGGHLGLTIFTDEAVKLIADYSRGIPRIINSLCENALLTGCALNRPQIDAAIIQEAADDLMLSHREDEGSRQQENDKKKNEILQTGIPEQTSEEPAALTPPRPLPAFAWRWAMGLAVFLLILMFAPAATLIDRYQHMNAEVNQALVHPKDPTTTLRSLHTENQPRPLSVATHRSHLGSDPEFDGRPTLTSVQKASYGEALFSPYDVPPDETPREEEASRLKPFASEFTDVTPTNAAQEEPAEESTSPFEEARPIEMPTRPVQSQQMIAAYLNALKTSQDSPHQEIDRKNPLDAPPAEGFYKRRIYPGDTITSLARDNYGHVNSHVLAVIKAANPDLEDLDVIVKDTYINLPNMISGPALIKDSSEQYFVIVFSCGSRTRIDTWEKHIKAKIKTDLYIREIDITSERKIYQIESMRYESISEAQSFIHILSQIPLFAKLKEEYNEPNI
ncbi:ExeA family protein [Desulfatiglans anilini]|uniref:ExeA family protein n=1 Tax=Desulfatiglans anilini TaxID=90728 RepID=UPI0004100596|nr:AAA family ATPase [Desulfatiglans anilini]